MWSACLLRNSRTRWSSSRQVTRKCLSSTLFIWYRRQPWASWSLQKMSMLLLSKNLVRNLQCCNKSIILAPPSWHSQCNTGTSVILRTRPKSSVISAKYQLTNPHIHMLDWQLFVTSFTTHCVDPTLTYIISAFCEITTSVYLPFELCQSFCRFYVYVCARYCSQTRARLSCYRRQPRGCVMHSMMTFTWWVTLCILCGIINSWHHFYSIVMSYFWVYWTFGFHKTWLSHCPFNFYV